MIYQIAKFIIQVEGFPNTYDSVSSHSAYDLIIKKFCPIYCMMYEKLLNGESDWMKEKSC